MPAVLELIAGPRFAYAGAVARATAAVIGLAGCASWVHADEPLADIGPASAWPDRVELIALNNGVRVRGDLKNGRPLDLDWADDSSVACWPGTENVNFRGNHVLFATKTAQQAHSSLSVTVTPDEGVDVSVYIYQIGLGNHYLPPDLPSAVTCEAAYDMVNDSNPGVTETTRSVQAIDNPYNVVIGVAGAKGYVTGGFTLELHYQHGGS